MIRTEPGSLNCRSTVYNDFYSFEMWKGKFITHVRNPRNADTLGSPLSPLFMSPFYVNLKDYLGRNYPVMA